MLFRPNYYLYPLVLLLEALDIDKTRNPNRIFLVVSHLPPKGEPTLYGFYLCVSMVVQGLLLRDR